MYTIIYQFILDNIFNGSALNDYTQTINGVSTNMNVWLAHTTTIIIMCLIVTILVLLVRWFFRIVSSGFLLR